MLKSSFLYIILQAFAMLLPCAFAQTAAIHPFKTMTVADGLPQSFISGLVQDQQGFVWIATRDGLARYDGLQYKLFSHVPGDTASLAANTITNLYLDNHSQLWILYETGALDILNTFTEHLFHFSRHPVFAQITRQTKGCYSNARFMAEDGDNNYWLLGDQGGVFVCNLTRPSCRFLSDSALGCARNHITGVAAYNGRILLITDTALVTITAALHTQVIPYTFDSAHLYVPDRRWKDNSPLIRNNGDIVFINNNRLILWQAINRRFTVIPLPALSKYAEPCMTMAPSGDVYFDYYGTLYQLTAQNKLVICQNAGTGLYPNNISMLLDRSGVLWVGSNGSGVKLYDLRLPHITGFTYAKSFFRDVLVMAVKVPEAEVATSFIETARPYLVKQATDKSGKLWMSLYGRDTFHTYRLYYLENRHLIPVDCKQAIEDTAVHQNINAIAFSRNGTLWGIDFLSRLIQLDIQHHSFSATPPLTAARGINALLTEGDSTFWFTTLEKGLFKYELATRHLVHYAQTDQPGQLPQCQLLQLIDDPADSSFLWITSMGGGLIRFNKKTGVARCFTTKDGLPNNTVYTVIQDQKGIFWCSSNKGIFTFHPHTHTVRSFTAKDGLFNDEFNRFHFLHLPDGRMAFGGVDDYTVFDPLAITDDRFNPDIVLTGLRIHNEPADYGSAISPFTQSLNSLSKITLPWYQNFLTFHFAALEYNIPDKLQYRYQLVGLDDKWVYAKTGNDATYTNIPPGHYELRINATNTSGIWSSHIKSIILVITPPFWKTWWFIVLSVLIISAATVFIIYNRIQSIRKREKQQLAFDREVMELEAQALRAQMNPHFIFNCLNAIKLLIQEDKKQEAVVYLTTFSKLIRNQLSNTQKEISLAEELKTCRLYTQMEALRFGPRMHCVFIIPENADIYAVMVPPLIIQPFIENAIWHGILPREEGGTVTITVEGTADAVICTVDDNGIGRARSQQFKTAPDAGHQSKGMQLTQSRLHLYNLVQHRGGTITITDKKDAQGNDCGTTVAIRFKKEI